MYLSACPSAVNFLGKWEILIGDTKYLSDFSHRCHVRSRTVSTSTPRRCPQGHGLAVTGAAGAHSPENTEGTSQPQGGCARSCT